MKIKDLKKILSEVGSECDEYPVRVFLEKVSEEDGGGKRYSDLDEINWEFAGTTSESSFLSIDEKNIVII